MNDVFSALPGEIYRLIAGSPAQIDDIGRSCAKVLMSEEMCLKIAPQGSLRRAAVMQEYFHKKGLSAPLVKYVQSNGQDFLLMRRVSGSYACDSRLMSDPVNLARRIGEAVRMLHETDASDCPLKDANRIAYDAMCAELSGVEALNCPMPERFRILKNDALIHGDCCLPNIFFEGDRFCGFVDLGESGLGDRHFDLYWAAWSLGYNLGTDQYRDDFLDAYGRDAIDIERAKLCAYIANPKGSLRLAAWRKMGAVSEAD